MTEEEIKNKISEYKECCKKLAEEYRQRYNKDNTDKLALNMFYHNVISYNDFENVLAIIEDRNSMIMCFSEPPILTEETVEVDIKRIAELEAIVRNTKAVDESFAKLQLENTELKAQIEKMKNCKNCKKLKKEKDGLLICTVGRFYINTFGENCDKWEMIEK